MGQAMTDRPYTTDQLKEFRALVWRALDNASNNGYEHFMVARPQEILQDLLEYDAEVAEAAMCMDHPLFLADLTEAISDWQQDLDEEADRLQEEAVSEDGDG